MTDSKKIKIGFLITKGVWGGAQKYVYTIATSLSKEKYDVFVITGNGDRLKEKLEEKGVRIHIIENLRRDISMIAEIKSFFSILSIIWKERPDVLHLNSPKASGLGSFAGRILFVPKIIQTIHGFTWNEDRGVTSKMLITFFTWLTTLFCHNTIVLSTREERQAKTLPLVKKKIILIRNGIEKINFKTADDAKKELLAHIDIDIASNALWIGTIAELHKNKGFEYALHALVKIRRPFAYFILGGGEEKNNLEKLVEQYDLKGKVFLLDFVDQAQEYLKAFDLFLLSSIKEGLPYVLLEAGQAGLPIIASTLGGIPDLIENGKSGILVTPKKSGEITRAIEYLIDTPDEQKIFGKNIQKKVETDFSMEQMLQKTETLYKHI
jgi:glycosyltransferase involved in cell wall biosynthesis